MSATPIEVNATVRVDWVQVADHHRQDLGDIAALARSIQDVGLLHPLTVTRDGRLIAGQRRLEACRLLGWDRVPVRFADNLDDATKQLHAERDENTCRKDMTPSEKVTLAQALRELVRRDAEGRKGGRPLKTDENFTSVSQPPVRDQLGAAVGLSGPTLERAQAVVQATQDPNPEIRQVAERAKDEMDRTGKVTPAFDKVAEATGRKPAYWGKAADRQQSKQQSKRADAASEDWIPEPTDRSQAAKDRRKQLIRELAPKGYTSTQIGELLGRRSQHIRDKAKTEGIEIVADKAMARSQGRIDSNRIVRETVRMLADAESALDMVNFDELDRAEIPDWTSSLGKSIRRLNRLNAQLKELTQ